MASENLSYAALQAYEDKRRTTAELRKKGIIIPPPPRAIEVVLSHPEPPPPQPRQVPRLQPQSQPALAAPAVPAPEPAPAPAPAPAKQEVGDQGQWLSKRWKRVLCVTATLLLLSLFYCFVGCAGCASPGPPYPPHLLVASGDNVSVVVDHNIPSLKALECFGELRDSGLELAASLQLLQRLSDRNGCRVVSHLAYFAATSSNAPNRDSKVLAQINLIHSDCGLMGARADTTIETARHIQDDILPACEQHITHLLSHRHKTEVQDLRDADKIAQQTDLIAHAEKQQRQVVKAVRLNLGNVTAGLKTFAARNDQLREGLARVDQAIRTEEKLYTADCLRRDLHDLLSSPDQLATAQFTAYTTLLLQDPGTSRCWVCWFWRWSLPHSHF